MRDDSRPLRFLTFSVGDIMVFGAEGKGPKRINEPLLTLCSLDLILETLNPKCLESLMDMCLRVSFELSSIPSIIIIIQIEVSGIMRGFWYYSKRVRVQGQSGEIYFS